MAETLRPGTTVNAVPARFDIHANQPTSWRRMAKGRILVLPADERDGDAVMFALLVVCDAEAPASALEYGAGECDVRVAVGDEFSDAGLFALAGGQLEVRSS